MKRETKKIRIVWAEGLNTKELKKLRKEIELALSDPDYAIIANHEIHWDEIKIKKNSTLRIVWADSINDKEVINLREQVDKALSDPNYIIITNYEIHWNEI